MGKPARTGRRRCFECGQRAGQSRSFRIIFLLQAQPYWINAAAYQCGVRNYYEEASQLGSDRWAALIAAWQQQRQGCLVVDAGTATTIDALSDTGEFLGGIITPGVDLMQKALMENAGSLKPEA